MEFYLSSVSDKSYTIGAPQDISSPRLLLFHDRFRYNIGRMRELLQSVAPGCGMDSLCPHVKTHKSVWVTQQLMEAGIRAFKTCPNEVEMLVEAGVNTMFVAYPLVFHEALRIGKLAGENKHIRFIVQASHPKHIEYLLAAAKTHDIRWPYFIDVDVGMHRTGLSPEYAWDFFRSIDDSDHLHFIGFHGYDGHNASPNLNDRQKTSRASVDLLVEVFRKFDRQGIRVPKLMMGGTPSFLTDLEYLSSINLDTEIILSPGTWVFFDTKDAAILPNTFDVAACVLAQVMDRPDSTVATVNLGYKRWSLDQGPVEGFSVDGMRALSWSEEHTVVSVPKGAEVNIGDYVLIAPKHVCSTINLWEHFDVINSEGEVEIRNCPVDARNR